MNNLTLRTLTSPYINDVTRGSVLSQADVDNNFIFLKGNIIYTAETVGNIVTLKRFNGDDLSFIAGETFTGGTVSGPTNFTNGLTADTFSATTYFGLPQDIYVTGGTYSSGTTTFTNNLGNTFDVTGYFTGSTVVPSEIVYFDSTNPNISGTTFDPDIQMSADTLYVSSVDANTWVYSGASYVTYSAATVSNTEFNLNGTSVDAGGNKTAHISRSGSITIGGTGATSDKFSVFSTGGTKSLVVDVNGFVYNTGKGSISTNTVFGLNALSANTTGNSNTAIGNSSLNANTTGIANSSLGISALRNNTTANYNTAVGFNASYFNTIGGNNVAVGAFSLYSNTGNTNNTAIGTNALRLSNGGYDNTALGFQALYSNTVGYSNTALGKDTLFANTSGFVNVAIGDRTLFSNTTGSYNNGLGYRALYTNTIGNYNVALGYQALYLNLSGNSNTAIGASVLNSNSTGSNNIGIGTNALKQSTTASNNIGIGINALSTSTTGVSNIGIGTSSQQLLTVGISNISIGSNSSTSNVTGSANVAIGQDSLYNNTSSNNTAIGYRSGYQLINGTSNTIIGANSVVPSGLTSSLVLSDGNGVVKLSGDSSHKLWIPNNPSTGTTSDALLVRTSSGEIKQLPTSSVITSGGVFGISNSAGTYTYYSTLTLAMSAASGGQTIEMFSDYIESVSGTTVLIKPNVIIQGNGHRYKHTASGDTDTFSFGTNADHFIYNLQIERTNATGGYVFNRVPYVPYNVYCNGTTISTNQNGVLFHFSQPGNVYNLTLIITGTGTGVQGSGSNFNNCTFLGTSTSSGSLASAGVTLNNCNVINRGTGTSIGDCYLNNTSVISYASACVSGAYGISNSYIYSLTSFACSLFNGGLARNSVFISSGSYAATIYNANSRYDNCLLWSTVNNAFYAALGGDLKFNNCVLLSSSAVALNAHSVEATNCTIESLWGNASGHAVAIVSNDSVITNCMLRVANSSANAIYASSAYSPKFANNVYANMTTPINANITQGIINSHDSQGNILI